MNPYLTLCRLLSTRWTWLVIQKRLLLWWIHHFKTEWNLKVWTIWIFRVLTPHRWSLTKIMTPALNALHSWCCAPLLKPDVRRSKGVLSAWHTSWKGSMEEVYMQVPNGTGSGVRRSKCVLSAWHTSCKRSMENFSPFGLRSRLGTVLGYDFIQL